MQGKNQYRYFKPTDAGITYEGDTVLFAFDAGTEDDPAKCGDGGLILYDRNGKSTRIPFSEEGRNGSLYGIMVDRSLLQNRSYNYYRNDRILHDPMARTLTGVRSFGVMTPEEEIRCVLPENDFDWQDDRMKPVPYEDSIFYGLNVRAFTMHRSSKVSHKGTFEGVTEKIPYLRSLGVTALVLMPCYEYDECENMRKKASPRNMEEAKDASLKEGITAKVNCWGFTKGYYFAPKSAYASGNDPVNSFKTMVRELHRAGIEVIMQFYFPAGTSASVMIRALKFWMSEYHVDGFRINGYDLPYRIFLSEPAFRSVKLWFDYIPYEEMEHASLPKYFRMASTNNGNFRNDLRRFVKGDEGMINEILHYQKCNPEDHGAVNFICDYDGFTLADLYAYERKHNEDNGEDNRDGADINYSWNCGTEGPTRKKAVNLLRIKEMKNALTLLFISAGTPYLFAGDEFMNSRNGNNNAYCQDNDTGYVEWKDTQLSREILEFTKGLIALRKNNPILHMPKELKGLDVNGLGYPDISYHGYEAWRPDLNFISRILGIFLYGPASGDKKAPSYYIGINMHWENHALALPKLKNGYVYEKILDTGDGKTIRRENEMPVGERSIVIYEAVARNRKK